MTETDGELSAAGQPVFSDPSGVRAAVTRVVLGLAIVAMVAFLVGFGVELTRSPWPRGVGLPGLTPRHGPVTITPDHRLAIPSLPDPAVGRSVATGGASPTPGNGQPPEAVSSGPASVAPPLVTAAPTPSATTVAVPTTVASPGSTAPGITTATTRPSQTTSSVAHGPPVSTPGGTTPTTARGRAP